MPELNIVIMEFVKATSYCIEERKGQHIKDNKYFAIDRAVIEELLNIEEYKYETSAEKLARWKRLHWIDADEKHITKNVYLKEESKSRRMIVIDLSVHGELLKICS